MSFNYLGDNDNNFRDSVATAVDLPATGNNLGDKRYTQDTGMLYTWAGTAWVVASSGGVASSVTVTNFPATQAISATSLPLPTGAATSALQGTANTSLSSIDSKTPALGQALAAASVPVVLTAAQLSTLTPLSSVSVSNFPASQAVTGAFFQATQPVSIATMPTTPVTGTFWQATQPVSGTVAVSNAFALDSSLTTMSAKLPTALGTKTIANSMAVNIASDQTVPVSGTFFQATQPVSAAALPLPTGAATSGLQTTISGQLPATLGQKAMTASMAVTLASDQSALAISAAALPLPTGASTSGLQTTGNASIASIDTKTPALGQALAAASVPVVLTAAQLSTLTPLSSVSVSNFPASQAVTGTFWQSTQPVSIASMPSTPVTGPLTDTQLRATAVPVSGTFFQSTQPISAAALPLPTGAAADATVANVQGTVAAGTAATKSGLAGGVFNTVLPTLTNAQQAALQLTASGKLIVDNSTVTQPVSGTFFQATQPISAATLPLPTGAALDSSVTAMSAKLPATLGQKAMAASTSVAIASDQSAIPVTQATLTKGTQGATGVSTQDLKDAGRNITNYMTFQPVQTTATETLQTLQGYKSGTSVTATTTPAVVTAGKTYRIQSIIATYMATTTAGVARCVLRAQLGGVVTVTSAPVMSWIVGSSAFVAGVTYTQSLPIPEGLEFAAGTGIGISVVGQGPTNSALITGFVDLKIIGYEY